MDELDLAKRAVRRSLLSEEQLREAQQFAAGGRSLLAVLLDLGYLRSHDLPDLLSSSPRPASPPQPRSRAKSIAMVVLPMIFLAVLFRGCIDRERETSRRAEVFRLMSHTPPPAPVPISERSLIKAHLYRRANAILSAVDAQHAHGAPLSASEEHEVRHAASLLDEAVIQGLDDLETRTALGRANELLDRWESAAENYRRALQKSPDDPAAHLGIARVLLLLDRPLQAHAHATAACSGPFAGEAFLVRAKADLNVGNKEEARANVDLAARKDPSLASQARALRMRIDE
jgi:tetratricopeptide (TPR) repeat protein